jgi:hypothetical protein
MPERMEEVVQLRRELELPHAAYIPFHERLVEKRGDHGRVIRR